MTSRQDASMSNNLSKRKKMYLCASESRKHDLTKYYTYCKYVPVESGDAGFDELIVTTCSDNAYNENHKKRLKTELLPEYTSGSIQDQSPQPV